MERSACPEWSCQGDHKDTEMNSWTHGCFLHRCFAPQVQTQIPKCYLHFTHSTESQRVPPGCSWLSLLQTRVTQRWRRAAGGEETAVSNHGSSFPLTPCTNIQRRFYSSELCWESTLCVQIRVQTATVISSQVELVCTGCSGSSFLVSAFAHFCWSRRICWGAF